MLRRSTEMGRSNAFVHRSHILDYYGIISSRLFCSSDIDVPSLNLLNPLPRLACVFVGRADERLTLQPHTIPSFTGVLILPIVTLVVLSATGATLCSVMSSESDALYRTMLASYAALAIGFPLTHIILVLYFLRLLVHKVHTPPPPPASSYAPSQIPLSKF